MFACLRRAQAQPRGPRRAHGLIGGERDRRQPGPGPCRLHVSGAVRRPRPHLRPDLPAGEGQRPARARQLPHARPRPGLGLRRRPGGPAVSLRSVAPADSGIKLLVVADSGDGFHADRDLPRNAQGRALTGDPRNDENLITAQLHLLFIRFHNRVVDEVRAQQQLAARGCSTEASGSCAGTTSGSWRTICCRASSAPTWPRGCSRRREDGRPWNAGIYAGAASPTSPSSSPARRTASATAWCAASTWSAPPEGVDGFPPMVVPDPVIVPTAATTGRAGEPPQGLSPAAGRAGDRMGALLRADAESAAAAEQRASTPASRSASSAMPAATSRRAAAAAAEHARGPRRSGLPAGRRRRARDRATPPAHRAATPSTWRRRRCAERPDAGPQRSTPLWYYVLREAKAAGPGGAAPRAGRRADRGRGAASASSRAIRSPTCARRPAWRPGAARPKDPRDVHDGRSRALHTRQIAVAAIRRRA